jgi:hypothetical protein
MKQRIATAITICASLGLSMFGASYTFHSGDGGANGTIVDGTGLNPTIGTQTNTLNGPGTPGPGTDPTYNINRGVVDYNGVWGEEFSGANWVSRFQTATPGGALTNSDYVDFYHTFTLVGTVNVNPILRVWADDTADVYVNGLSQFVSTQVSGSQCNNGEIGCTDANARNIEIDKAIFVNGTNELRVRVYQNDGFGFGLMYTTLAQIQTTSVGEIPEPSSYALISLGLGGLLIAFKRRQNGSSN